MILPGILVAVSGREALTGGSLVACSYLLRCSYFRVQVVKALRLAGRWDKGIPGLRCFQGITDWVLKVCLSWVLNFKSPVLGLSGVGALRLVESLSWVGEGTLVFPPQISLEIFLHLIQILLILLIKVNIIFRMVLSIVRERPFLRSTHILSYWSIMRLYYWLLLGLSHVLLMGIVVGFSGLLVILSLLVNRLIGIWRRTFNSFFPISSLQSFILRINNRRLLILRRLSSRSLKLRSRCKIIRR